MKEPVIPNRPTRDPDLYLDDITIWWDEKLVGDYFLSVLHFNVDNLSYYSHYQKKWDSLVISKKDKDILRASYAEWLLEKELLK